MKRYYVHMICNAVRGMLFGICFLSGLAFLSGSQAYYEVTGSMQPVLKKGSLLFVREKNRYEKGDIVAFYTRYEGQVLCVTHRIVGRQTDGRYITKGDANASADTMPVEEQDILGNVVGAIPVYGYICAFVKQHRLLVLLFIMLGVPLYKK